MTTTAQHDWPMVRLGDVCDISIGKTPSRKNPAYWGSGHPWLSIKDMNQGTTLSSTAEQITDLAVEETRPRLCAPGTVLFSFKLSIGKVGFAKIPLYTNEAIAALLPKDKTSLSNGYLFHAMKHYGATLEGNRAVMGQTLNKKSLGQVGFPLPPLEEQHRIAEIMDAVASLCVNQEQKVSRIRELVNTVTEQVAAEASDSIVFGELCDIQGGVSLGGLRKTYRETAPYLRVANVFRNEVTLDEIKTVPVKEGETEKYSLRAGDILIVEGHGNREEVGRGAVLTTDLPGHVYQNHLFRARAKDDVPPEVLVRLWNSTPVRRQLRRSVATTSGLNTTSISKIRSLEIPLPTESEQQTLLHLIKQHNDSLAIENQRLHQLQELQTVLSTRAFQGEL
ncbi:restriction endonuclease subunit S [Corynebacterium lizhenjunii]|uniref:restriction endonuclease subunit S n=1 Tax=Corynebacterium lizhenjunii TaxID=2709394 RepID=UPI0013ED3E9F|nr:restriction endonuclease subunit S [Corynebacterium lizhenjunii]